MKKKRFFQIIVLGILALTGIIWYRTPVDFVRLSPENVLKIVLFDGNSGKGCHIQDPQDIQHIIENLNTIKLQRDKLSIGYVGYRFQTTIYLTNGEEANGWNHFILNSNDTVRKDPFFYKVVEGEIDIEYLQKRLDASFP